MVLEKLLQAAGGDVSALTGEDGLSGITIENTEAARDKLIIEY